MTYEQLREEINHAGVWYSHWLKKYYSAASCFMTADKMFLCEKYGYPSDSKQMSRIIEDNGVEVYIPFFEPDGGKKVTREALAKFRHMEEKLEEWKGKMETARRAINKGEYEF